MILEEALQTISDSLKSDNRVQAIFLKGSIARDEHDEYSDIDIYCLVDEKDVDSFNNHRIKHLESYGRLLFHDDIFIIAPQILAVYDNLLHVDLFTVTEKTYDAKDYIKVLYDPKGKVEKYMEKQSLTLDDTEFQDDVDDVAWFLFQYINSSKRGNDIWSVNMLQHVMNHLSRVLLHRYRPERAQLGTKTIEASLNKEIVNVLHSIHEDNTPSRHKHAFNSIRKLLLKESNWILSNVKDPEKIKPIWNHVVNFNIQDGN